MINRTVLKCVAVAAAGLATSAAWAQDTTAAVVAAQAGAIPKGYASPLFQVPSAAGSGWGTVSAAVYGQTIDYGGSSSASDKVDGSMGINVGLGNPSKYVGLDVSLGLSSLTGKGGAPGNQYSFGESGAFGAKLHTNLPGLMSFAVGVQSIGRFGALKQPGVGKSSVYAALSKFVPLDNGQGLALEIGTGDGAFSSNSTLGPFGSVAWYIIPQISLIGEYTGRFANVAVSAAPFKSLPFTITLGGVNLNDRTNGPGTQFAGSIGYAFTF